MKGKKWFAPREELKCVKTKILNALFDAPDPGAVQIMQYNKRFNVQYNLFCTVNVIMYSTLFAVQFT